jgi:hypothetical protein
MTEDRDKDGLFQPGHAIKGGRRAGPTAGDLIRAQLLPHREAVIKSLIEFSKAGDVQAQRLFLSYFPAPKPDSERTLVPGLASAKTLTGKADAVIAAVADGSISAEAGERILRLLGVYARAAVVDEHGREIEALKAALAGRTIESSAEEIPEDLI